MTIDIGGECQNINFTKIWFFSNHWPDFIDYFYYIWCNRSILCSNVSSFQKWMMKIEFSSIQMFTFITITICKVPIIQISVNQIWIDIYWYENWMERDKTEFLFKQFSQRMTFQWTPYKTWKEKASQWINVLTKSTFKSKIWSLKKWNIFLF